MIARLAWGMLAAYLAMLTCWTRYPRHVRQEQELLRGSIEDEYRRGRQCGCRPARAALLALWSHRAELQPLAVVATVRAEDACAGRDSGDRVGLGWISAATLLVASSAALWRWGPEAASWLLVTVGALTISWIAGHVWRRPARWLIVPAALSLVWPFLQVRVVGRDGSFTDLVVIAIIAAAGTLATWRWRGSSRPEQQHAVLALSILAVGWCVATPLHEGVRAWILLGAIDETGVGRIERVQWLTVAWAGQFALYWLFVGTAVSRFAHAVRAA